MVMLHCPDGSLPLMVIHVMVLVWGKDPQKLREVSASKSNSPVTWAERERWLFPYEKMTLFFRKEQDKGKESFKPPVKVGHWWWRKDDHVVPVHKRVSTMYEFQPGEIRQDMFWSDSWMAGMLLWGAGGQDPDPVMNLKGFGGFPVTIAFQKIPEECGVQILGCTAHWDRECSLCSIKPPLGSLSKSENVVTLFCDRCCWLWMRWTFMSIKLGWSHNLSSNHFWEVFCIFNLPL